MDVAASALAPQLPLSAQQAQLLSTAYLSSQAPLQGGEHFEGAFDCGAVFTPDGVFLPAKGLTQEQLATLAREVQRAAAQQAVANLIRSGELQQPAYAPPAAGGLLMPCPTTEQAALSAAFMPPASQEAFFAPAPPVGIPPSSRPSGARARAARGGRTGAPHARVLPTKPCPLAHDAALGAPWLLPSARAEGAAASGGTGVFLPCAAPPTRRGGGTHGGGGPAALLAGAGAPKGALHGSPSSSASSLFSLGRGSPAASLAGSPGMDALAPLGCLPPHDAGPAAAGAGLLGYAGQCAGGSSEALDALVAKFFRMPQGGHLAGDTACAIDRPALPDAWTY